MAQLGTFVLLLALGLASYSLVASVVGVRKGKAELVDSGRYAAYAVPLVLLVAVLALVGAFVSHDFGIKYVADHSNRAMEPQFTWVAFYAGNEGSLLFIAFALAAFGALAIYKRPNQIQDALPYVNAVIMLVLIFFTAVMAFMANPFATSAIVPADGRGINPLLTHPGMFLHPPILMSGLVLVTIPFAYATGSLLAGKTGDEWVIAGRQWGLVSWGLLGVGLLLGGWWAYTILGWGGYWAWDPVENAGLMPWLGLTAFLHSIMVQARRGMFRMWNIALINIAFLLAAFGMFINRGGPVPSVHSFGASALGWTFLIFLGTMSLLSFGLFFYRYASLKSAQNLESTVSREAAFLVNNVLLLFIAFVTLWGVVFPLFSQVARGDTVTIAAPFYDRINGPAFLALIFLMGVGPLIPWRHANLRSVRSALLVPVSVAVGLAVFLAAVGVRNPYALASFSLSALVAVGILREWFRGTLSRHHRGENYGLAFLRLIGSNRPRYGGYVVHLAIVMLALGITGSSLYNVQRDVVLGPGESATIGSYQVQYLRTTETIKADRVERTALLRAFEGSKPLGEMKATYDFYPSFRIASTRSAIRSTPVEDLYVIPREFFDDGSIGLRILVNPLVWWMWVSGPILILGTFIALWPRRQEVRSLARRPAVAAWPSTAGQREGVRPGMGASEPWPY